MGVVSYNIRGNPEGGVPMVQFIAGFFVGGFAFMAFYAFLLVASEDDDEKRTRK